MTTSKIVLVTLACFLASPLEAKEPVWDNYMGCWSSGTPLHICDITSSVPPPYNPASPGRGTQLPILGYTVVPNGSWYPIRNSSGEPDLTSAPLSVTDQNVQNYLRGVAEKNPSLSWIPPDYKPGQVLIPNIPPAPKPPDPPFPSAGKATQVLNRCGHDADCWMRYYPEVSSWCLHTLFSRRELQALSVREVNAVDETPQEIHWADNQTWFTFKSRYPKRTQQQIICNKFQLCYYPTIVIEYTCTYDPVTSKVVDVQLLPNSNPVSVPSPTMKDMKDFLPRGAPNSR
jgi:hypothetical protein